MKQLKLEVGKTYRSRKGEKVKIVRAIDSIWAFVGDNEESYNEQGRYYSANWDSPDDLIEEVEEVEELPKNRHTFDIPNGVKKVTVEQVGNRIVVDMVPEERKEPKPGDVMVNEHGSVYIFKEVCGDGWPHNHFAWVGSDGRVFYSGAAIPGRPATAEEAQPLFDALKKAGKRWNPETMQVEEVPEIDHIREWLKSNWKSGYYSQDLLGAVILCYLKHREGKK